MLTYRPYQAGDATEIVSWVRDERTYFQWCAGLIGTYPITTEHLEERIIAYPNNAYLVFSDERGVAGFLSLFKPEQNEPLARVGFVILDANRRGLGLGNQMIALAVKYAVDEWKAEKVTLCVFANNPSARRCYEKAGFTAASEQPETCLEVMGEKWARVEMEWVKA